MITRDRFDMFFFFQIWDRHSPWNVDDPHYIPAKGMFFRRYTGIILSICPSVSVPVCPKIVVSGGGIKSHLETALHLFVEPACSEQDIDVTTTV